LSVYLEYLYKHCLSPFEPYLSNHTVSESQQEKSKEDIAENLVNYAIAVAKDNIIAMDRDYNHKTSKSSAAKHVPFRKNDRALGLDRERKINNNETPP
jgi:hypothetical protein